HPSAPDLLVARRQPAVGGPVPRPRCVLAGDLSAFPIADFVAFVHQSRLGGLLTVSGAGFDRSVVFRDGEVRGALSDAPGERIGDVAVRLGYLSEARLAEVAGAGPPPGKVLVERGLVSAADVWKCLHEQVAAVFHAILLTREGVFTMVDEAQPEPGTPLAVNTQSLLMDGIRRIDEMSLFRARIPGPDAYPRRRDPKVPITLKPSEARILELVDGRRTVADVAREAHQNEFDATKILYHLSEAGYVEAAAQPSAARRATPEERLAAVADGLNAILAEIAAAVAAASGDALAPAVRAFLGDPASRYAPLWTHVSLRRDGAVETETVLGNLAALPPTALARLEPSRDPVRLLFAALRELMFFYLFQAGGRLARDADDRLARSVKARFEALGDLA
ncbi:MAG TPA: DUF4388 domain-containing protein, partial [Anaeromyxobacteraceae bacterium]|nr:DUF4388 domain-containing protein [Anaeromyxobacteraceae bacterium]